MKLSAPLYPTAELKVTFGVGVDLDGHPLHPDTVREGLDAIYDFAAREFGGYTAQESRGGWVNGKDQLVVEPGRVLTIYLPKRERRYDVDGLVAVIKRTLRQESVVVAITQSSLAFA